ncbi:MAG: orotate phosphoribosyltransferase [Dehalococcoidia bacterium]
MPGAETARAEEILRRSGALLEGHFQLTSGRHSPVYVEKFRILEKPAETEQLCRMIADRFRGEGASVVVGPTTGGIILSYEVARQLERLPDGRPARGIFAEMVDGADRSADTQPRRRLGRGFRMERGERALVVDDVLTTGGSVRQVLAALAEEGGLPVGVGVLVDRRGRGQGNELDFGVPLFACLTVDLPTYEPTACPLCQRGEPLTPT